MIVFDIETVSNPDLEKFVEPAKAPANYKDQLKIDSYIKEKTQENIDKMSLDIDYCKIKSLAFNIGLECIEPEFYLCNTIEEETKALEAFWDASDGKYLCGYNIIGFDIPIIARRSFVLPVFNFRKIMITRYNPEVIDLMYKLYHDDRQKFKSLKKVCAIYNINNPLPDVDGSMVKDMDSRELRAYAVNDVRMTCELAKKMQGYYF